MEALELFGGKDRVMNRMNRVVCRKAMKTDERTAAILEEAFFLKRGAIKRLRANRKKADIYLFDKISCPLGITLTEAIGKPNLKSKAVRRWWEEHKRQNWIAKKKKTVSALSPDLDIPLEIYVTLKAAEELRASNGL